MVDNINCVPYGYNPSNEIPETISTDEEDDFTTEEDMLHDKILAGMRKKR